MSGTKSEAPPLPPINEMWEAIDSGTEFRLSFLRPILLDLHHKLKALEAQSVEDEVALRDYEKARDRAIFARHAYMEETAKRLLDADKPEAE